MCHRGTGTDNASATFKNVSDLKIQLCALLVEIVTKYSTNCCARAYEEMQFWFFNPVLCGVAGRHSGGMKNFNVKVLYKNAAH